MQIWVEKICNGKENLCIFSYHFFVEETMVVIFKK